MYDDFDGGLGLMYVIFRRRLGVVMYDDLEDVVYDDFEEVLGIMYDNFEVWASVR